MENAIHHSEAAIEKQPGDTLISIGRIPPCDLILQDFKHRHHNHPKASPRISFTQLQAFLEFLELIVLTERIIIPIPRFHPKTEKIIDSRNHWMSFARFRLAGDLDLDPKTVVKRLNAAGILFEAALEVGDPTADDLIARLVPTSKFLKNRFLEHQNQARDLKIKKADAFANASMAYWYGAPLHIAEAAREAQVPYFLDKGQEADIFGYERSILKSRQSITTLLLDRLNGGAKKELSKLSEFGVLASFPCTPIAYEILQNSATPDGLIASALQLRDEYAEYRNHITSLEGDLTNGNCPLKIRLKRLKEIETLASSLWPSQKGDLKTTALGVTEALAAIPELANSPSPNNITNFVTKLASLPTERLVEIYRRRKVRLLVKAKKNFLRAPDLTPKIAAVFNISPEIVKQSRLEGH